MHGRNNHTNFRVNEDFSNMHGRNNHTNFRVNEDLYNGYGDNPSIERRSIKPKKPSQIVKYGAPAGIAILALACLAPSATTMFYGVAASTMLSNVAGNWLFVTAVGTVFGAIGFVIANKFGRLSHGKMDNEHPAFTTMMIGGIAAAVGFTMLTSASLAGGVFAILTPEALASSLSGKLLSSVAGLSANTIEGSAAVIGLDITALVLAGVLAAVAVITAEKLETFKGIMGD